MNWFGKRASKRMAPEIDGKLYLSDIEPEGGAPAPAISSKSRSRSRTITISSAA